MLDKRMPLFTTRNEMAYKTAKTVRSMTWEYNYPYFYFYNEKGKTINSPPEKVINWCKEWIVKNYTNIGFGYSREEIIKMMNESKVYGTENR
jgi:hypothetical protein